MKWVDKSKKFIIYPALASALAFSPVKSISQSVSPDAPTSFYGDIALNPFVQPNYTSSPTPQTFHLNYYGSGDVNNDKKIDWADYNTILSNPSDRTDLNGDGVTNATDKTILLNYLTDAIPYLPAHWDWLQNRTERENWFNKVKTIDQTQVYHPGWNCTNYSRQFAINTTGVENISGWSGSSSYNITQNSRFNIPVYQVNTQTSVGVDHWINAINIGDSTGNFNSWYFIEPQNDTKVYPGNASMGTNSFANIKRFAYFWSSFLNQYTYGDIDLVNFDLQGGSAISTTIPNTETVLYRTLKNVHLQGQKPADANVDWQNGTANTNPSATGYPTGVLPSGTQMVYSDSTNQQSGNWNPAHYNYSVYRDWVLEQPNDEIIDTTLASRRQVFWNNGRAPQIITVQDTAKPVFTSTPNGLTLYFTQQNNIPAITATDNSGFWNSARTITSNQGTDPAQCNYYEFTKTVKDSVYDPSGNYRIANSLVNIVLDPTTWTYVPPQWTLNWPASTEPSNTGGYATATNPAGVAVNVTYADNSNQNSDTTKCEHYNFNINRTWTATTTPCNDEITSNQNIFMQENQPPIWTGFPPNIEVDTGQSIHPDYTGWPNGEDNISGMPVNKIWYDSITNSTPTAVYIDRHWTLEDICSTSTNDSVQQIIQDIIEGIPENKNKDNFKIYPNPANNYVNLVYTSEKPESARIIVNDLVGRKLEEIVVNQNIGENKISLDISGYPSGTYLINYVSPESTETEFFIKM